MREIMDQYAKGEIFHFYNRSVQSENLYLDHVDYMGYLDYIQTAIKDVPLTVIAYCLMPNHFHFLIRQDGDIPVFKLFHKVNTSYVEYFNWKYHRHGKLFGSKLNSIAVKSDEYLQTLIYYIHANPVRAGLVEDPADWKYSDYVQWKSSEYNTRLFTTEFRNMFFQDPEGYDRYFNGLMDAQNSF